MPAGAGWTGSRPDQGRLPNNAVEEAAHTSHMGRLLGKGAGPGEAGACFSTPRCSAPRLLWNLAARGAGAPGQQGFGSRLRHPAGGSEDLRAGNKEQSTYQALV